jgi:hypothetical protein
MPLRLTIRDACFILSIRFARNLHEVSLENVYSIGSVAPRSLSGFLHAILNVLDSFLQCSGLVDAMLKSSTSQTRTRSPSTFF